MIIVYAIIGIMELISICCFIIAIIYELIDYFKSD